MRREDEKRSSCTIFDSAISMMKREHKLYSSQGVTSMRLRSRLASLQRLVYQRLFAPSTVGMS